MINIEYIPTTNKINVQSDSSLNNLFKWPQPQILTSNTPTTKPETTQEVQPTSQIVTPTTSHTTSPITRGAITYKKGVDVGNMQEMIDRFADAGMNIHVVSGLRAAGAVGKAGNRSHHVRGNAIDIVPGSGETWESLRKKIKENEELKKWMREHKIGIIDETIPETMAKTGATGAHWHVGPDKWALRDFESIFAKQGGKLRRI